MSDNDSTIPRRPKPKTPDSFILETAEQSLRSDVLIVQFRNVGKVLVTVPIGTELLLGRFTTDDIGPLCLNLAAFQGAQQGVSRRHAKIKHDESGWLIEDSGSLNGTWLNGERLAPFHPCPLEPTSHLLMAEMECYVVLPAARTTGRFKTP